ncbi:hypothetical protein [Mycoplasmopsis columbinasalis]|uniref:Uncharacterized protein n=1 Tax=Mycoplasmopsis columbinasalis TaxID=114880 RepID=A0A449BAM5_9BACT|nr:hypothetical protein [Mycoplasmopsis columbinasalis]VEU78251.1 Uncharacterised protein [Mycoplasmopsis columbinasalis]
MLQPKNIKKTKSKIFKNLTILDFVILLVIVIFSLLVPTSLVPKTAPVYLKPLLMALLFGVSSILLIKIKKYDQRVYMFLFRMLCYSAKRKSFGSIKNPTETLIPYAEILENTFVKTKALKGGTRYFSVIKFKGKIPWSEEKADQISFLNKFIEILDGTRLQISFIRQRELRDYSKNFLNLQLHKNQKFDYLEQKNSSLEVMQNYTKLYEEKFADFDTLDSQFYVDTYYLVIYEKSI